MKKRIAFSFAKWMPLLAIAILILTGCKERNGASDYPTGNTLYMEISQKESTFFALQFNDEKVVQYQLEMTDQGVAIKETHQSTFSYDYKTRLGSFAGIDGTVTIQVDESGYLYDEQNKKIYTPKEGSIEDYTRRTPSVALTDSILRGPSHYCDTLIKTESLLQGGNLQFIDDALLKWAIDKIGTFIINKTGAAIYDEIFKSEESQKMDQILGKLDDIQHQIDQLMQIYKSSECQNAINARSTQFVIPMKNSAHLYMELLKEATTEEECKETVLEWASKNGNDTKCKDFIDFLLMNTYLQKNLYQIYDMYAFNCYAFESEGYPLRENLRMLDASVIIQYAYLTGLYYMYTAKTQTTLENLTKDLTQSLEQYTTFCNNNKVERHDDQIICQIKDAHFVMDKQLVLRDYKHHPWFEDGMSWDNEHGDAVYFVVYGDEKYTCHQVNHFCLRSEELKALNSFYAGKDTTLYDVLTSVGAVFPAKTAGQHYQMLLSGDGSVDHDEYNDYFIRATHSVNASEDLTDREYVTIGSAWLERYGFLWMLTRFARWSSYDDSKCWVRTNITERY